MQQSSKFASFSSTCWIPWTRLHLYCFRFLEEDSSQHLCLVVASQIAIDVFLPSYMEAWSWVDLCLAPSYLCSLGLGHGDSYITGTRHACLCMYVHMCVSTCEGTGQTGPGGWFAFVFWGMKELFLWEWVLELELRGSRKEHTLGHWRAGPLAIK